VTYHVSDRQIPVHASIIFVSYNTRALTLNAIQAVLRSVKRAEFGYEIIVVDNDSDDGSADAIERRFPDVNVIRSDSNLGFGRGNNLGADSARGEVLFFLNTDTEIESGAIERLYDYLIAGSARGVVGPTLVYPDGSRQRSIKTFPTVWRIFCEFFWLDRSGLAVLSGPYDNGADPGRAGVVEVVHGAALMIRRNLFENVGGFDPEFFMYYEECDLCRRVWDAGSTVSFVPEARVVHFEGASSSDTPWWFFRAMRNSRTVYAHKYFNRFGQIATACIVHSGYALRILLFTLAAPFSRRLRRLGRNMVLSYVRASGPVRG
jgi:GT2 family glycosyltransferase